MVRACQRIVASSWFEPLMLLLILVNAAALGLQTYHGVEAAIGDELAVADDVILGLFVTELAIRIVAHGRGFFRDGWNTFDFIVITASLVPLLRENLTVLRLLRLMRVVPALHMLPDLRLLTTAVARAMSGVCSLIVIALVLIYIYGMIGWIIFHEHDPESFGSLGQSMLTMFVLLTLENLPVYIERGQELSSWTVAFFVSYVLLASFLILNLFIGIIVDSMEQARESEDDAEAREGGEDDARTADRLQALKDAVEELERELAAQRAAR